MWLYEAKRLERRSDLGGGGGGGERTGSKRLGNETCREGMVWGRNDS